MNPVLSHVDVRVRDRAAATKFYDELLEPLGLVKTIGDAWTTYALPDGDDDVSGEAMWFGFTTDPKMQAGLTRIAFAAETCEDVDAATTAALAAGAKNVEGPDYDYGPEYYAVFFEDPDGNRLEVCCYGPRARAAS